MLATIASALPFLLVLACPIAMVLMMRGMHGSSHRGRTGGCCGGHDQHGHGQRDQAPKTLDELKRERDELNEEIGRRAEETVAR